MWTLRCLYELANWDSASFVTLTYNDDHVPKDYSLNPKHLQDFWKRLRKDLQGRKIRYYACGEYGSSELKYYSPGAVKPHGRPHYHAIVFGLSPYDDEDRKIISENWRFCDSFLFEKNRKEQAIAPVTREDIAYVCGYVQKKLNGDYAAEEYGQAVRPFSRCSQGIGLDFAMKNKERLINNGFTYLGNGKKIAIPRYFRDKFEVSAADLMHDDYFSSENFIKEQNALMNMFEEDMKKRGTWYPENLTMQAIRFERWLNDFNFELSRQVERDFNDFKRIRSKL